jgi:hypothetical protein
MATNNSAWCSHFASLLNKGDLRSLREGVKELNKLTQKVAGKEFMDEQDRRECLLKPNKAFKKVSNQKHHYVIVVGGEEYEYTLEAGNQCNCK